MNLETENLKSNLTDYVERHTQRSKSKNQYVCPLCNSGEGKNKTGAFTITDDGLKWKCFACNESGDIFDLIGKLENLPEPKEQFKRAAEIYGMEYTHTHNMSIKKEEKQQEENYSDFFLQANKALSETDYFSKRGLSFETVNRFNIGYVPNWKPPTVPKAPATPRLIIPTSEHSYLARDTRAEADIPEQQKAYTKQKVGKTHLFNAEALGADKPVFIVEGEIDALSVIEAGGEAVGLGSVGNYRKLLEAVKNEAPNSPLLIALDRDNKGEEFAQKLLEGLQQLKIPCCLVNITGEFKDQNEALINNRAEFIKAVSEAENLYKEAEQAEREEYLSSSSLFYLDGFINGIKDSVNTPYIPTGFPKLDTILDGGLYEGLYVIGAISSLGKTTYCLQLADQIAQAGNDVIVFSLEMARNELIAKSISRNTAITVREQDLSFIYAKTVRGITTGKRYENYNKTDKDVISRSVDRYRDYSHNIYINQGLGDIGAEQISETIAKHTRITGKSPVVIIDYMQILAPYNERYTDKQNTDRAVMALKRVSREYKIPIIAISSFNRQGYNEPVSMGSFKESGAIEYSSDVLIGLQLAGVGGKNFNVSEAKKANPRKVELVVLKNRNGRAGDRVSYKYYSWFNYFEEIEEEE